MKKSFDQNSSPHFNDLATLGGKGISQDEAVMFASQFFAFSKSKFYEQFLSYLANADQLAFEKLNTFLGLIRLREKQLNSLAVQRRQALLNISPKSSNGVTPGYSEMSAYLKNSVTGDDLMVLAQLNREDLTQLKHLLNGEKVDISNSEALIALFEKKAINLHSEMRNLQGKVHEVYNAMLKTLERGSFKYFLAFSDNDKNVNPDTSQSFPSFEAINPFLSGMSQSELEKLKGKSVFVVSVFEQQKSADSMQGDTGFVGKQKIGMILESKDGTVSFQKKTELLAKTINPNSSIASYYGTLKKLDEKIEKLTKRNWIWRLLETVFGHGGLTDQKKGALEEIKTKLESEKASLLNGRKKIDELIAAKLSEPAKGNQATQTVPSTWGDVIATSSFFKKEGGTTKTEKLLHEITEEARKPPAPRT